MPPKSRAKFRVRTSARDLGPGLVDLGMDQAFTDDADLSNASANLDRPSAVYHSAFIEVTEEGTEAAAGTTVHHDKKSDDTVRVQVDRAFMFVIRDLRTEAILFAGRVVDPTEERS